MHPLTPRRGRRANLPRSRLGAAVVALVIAAIGGGVTLALLRGDGPSHYPGELPFAEVTAARSPFAGFGAARVAVGERCVELLVAADDTTRGTGLRQRTTTGPYAGMLFAFPTEIRAGFTMARVPVPLTITWFGADGRPVDRARMEPCPYDSDDKCPIYESDRAFRYALEEVAPGAVAPGALGTC